MEEVERPTVLIDATCRTPNCVNENVTHRANIPVNSDGVFRVTCGTCANRITDLVEVND